MRRNLHAGKRQSGGQTLRPKAVNRYKENLRYGEAEAEAKRLGMASGDGHCAARAQIIEIEKAIGRRIDYRKLLACFDEVLKTMSDTRRLWTVTLRAVALYKGKDPHSIPHEYHSAGQIVSARALND